VLLVCARANERVPAFGKMFLLRCEVIPPRTPTRRQPLSRIGDFQGFSRRLRLMRPARKTHPARAICRLGDTRIS